MKFIKFIIALWGGKFALWLWKITGHYKDDKPGMISARICDDFLARVAKPKLTIVITGTNGKTTISNMLANTLKLQGYSVAYNDWGANHNAGQARCLLDAVNIFNKPTKDVAIIEADELLSPINMPQIKPNYIVINNVARDTMLRNGNPEYIRERLRKAAELTPEATVVLCADDPISCMLGEKNRRIYFGVSDLDTKAFDTLVDDFPICPVCGSKPRYAYRNYRHIGEFYCESCSFKTPNRDYFVEKVHSARKCMTVKEAEGEFEYPIISPAIHNIYNTAAIVAILRDIGIAPQKIAESFLQVQPPASREGNETVCDIELVAQLAKTQNATAVSTVFESIHKDPSKKLIIMVADEIFESSAKSETAAWMYDTDYEFLNSENIIKIIIGGDRYLDHKLRLLLAGIDEDKIVCVPKHLDTLEYVELDGVEKIYVIYDIYTVPMGRKVRDIIKERILNERGAK